MRLLRQVCVRLYPVVVAACILPGTFSRAEDAVPLIRQGNEVLAKRDWDGAVAKFSEAVRCDPKSVDAHLGLAHANWKKGILDLAIAETTRAIEIGPPTAKAYGSRGCFYLLLGDTQSATTT